MARQAKIHNIISTDPIGSSKVVLRQTEWSRRKINIS